MSGPPTDAAVTVRGLATVATVVVGLGTHASLLLALMAELLFVVPRFAAMYEGFGTVLPWSSQLAIAAAGAVVRWWPAAVAAALLFLPADAVAMVLLARRDGKVALRAWSLGVGVALGLLIVALFAAIYLPLPRLADTI